MSKQPVTFQSLVARAQVFATEWEGETAERAEKDSFWTEFFEIFGVKRRRVATFEYAAQRHSTGNVGHMDVFWPGKIAVEHKSLGHDLNEAMAQLFDYLQGESITDADLPELAVVCDFNNWIVRNLDTKEELRFTLADLPKHVGLFGFMAGFTRLDYSHDEDAASAEAAELLGRIHDELIETGYEGHDLHVLLVRLLFLLFADDTRVWPDGAGLFATWIHERTDEDGSDLGHHLIDWFEVLNTPERSRSSALPEELASLPFVNGGLFSEKIDRPYCNRPVRDRLLEACRFDWSKISPAVFGSMFQSVMDPVERRHLGAHYTSESNIRKLIDPLFMDELTAEFEGAGDGKSRQSRNKLESLLDKLGELRFLDPACGCGNFLVVTYRALRQLELEILKKLQREGVQQTALLEQLIRVRPSQFYGVEIEEFPAQIATTAMWLAAHVSNLELGEAFGLYYAEFPLGKSAEIHHGNALPYDWNDLIASSDCDYVIGNPPFIGRGMIKDRDRAELEMVWGDRLNGNIDYVSAWFAKTLDYLADEPDAAWAFVATNSMSQGEAVPTIWGNILAEGWRCRFAHRSVKWTSEARGTAAVQVSITGFDKRTEPRPELFTYDYGEPQKLQVKNISPYLFPGPNVIVYPSSRPLSAELAQIAFGSMPRDGGNLVVGEDDYETVYADQVARQYMRPYIGARQLLHGESRWCLWLEDLNPRDVQRSATLRKRLDAVRRFRAASDAVSTRDAADTPHLFVQRAQPATSYLAIPRVSSENRHYLPIGYFKKDVICSDALFSVADPSGFVFGVLSSAMFMTWQQTIGGRLESRLRFSKTLTYNNFPLPAASGTQRERVEEAAQTVLSARAKHPDATLADLYDPLAMPADLVKAHHQLDKAVDQIFSRSKRLDHDSRLAVLLDHYQHMANGSGTA